MRIRRALVVAALAVTIVGCENDGDPAEPTELLPVLRPAAGDIGARATVAGVGTVPDGFLAIGERFLDPTTGSGDIESVTTFWRSSDGRSWTMADAEPAVWADWSADRVAQSRRGIAVLGGGSHGRAVLTSSDGESWQVTGITSDLVGRPADTYPGAFPVNDIAATDRGFLALGSITSPAGRSRPLLLFSADGVDWQPASGPAFEDVSVIPDRFAGVVDNDGSLVAVVTAMVDDETRTRVWRSADGRTWEPLGGDDLFDTPAGPIRITAVVAFDGSLVAVGDHQVPGEPEEVLIWVSGDGEEWHLPPDGVFDPGSHAGLLVPRGDELLAIVTEVSDDPAAPAAIVAWSSPDGLRWRRLPPEATDAPTAPDPAIRGAASSGRDIAVVGEQYPGRIDIATVEMSAWWVEFLSG